MDFKIEKATLEDVSIAADLFNQYRVFYRQAPDYETCKAFIHDRLRQEQSHVFLVYAEGRPAGFVQLYELYHYIRLGKQWLLSDLFVHPDFRGRGLSVALIDRAKQWCDETSACGLMLETEKTNDIGNKLYPRCGFEYDGAHNYYYWWK